MQKYKVFTKKKNDYKTLTLIRVNIEVTYIQNISAYLESSNIFYIAVKHTNKPMKIGEIALYC